VNKKNILVEQRNGWIWINGKMSHLMFRGDVYGDGCLGETGRLCYKSDGIIVKFDDVYWKQSTKEIALWKSMDNEDKKYFGIVLGYHEDEGNAWIAVKEEKIRKIKKLSLKNEEILSRLIKKYKFKDVFVDINNNRGIREDGSLIIYDWGN